MSANATSGIHNSLGKSELAPRIMIPSTPAFDYYAIVRHDLYLRVIWAAVFLYDIRCNNDMLPAAIKDNRRFVRSHSHAHPCGE